MITRLDFRLQQDDPEEVVRASVQGGAGLAPGAAVVADTLRLLPGAIYEGSVRLFGADGQNLTGQVTQNPENHQFFYETDAEVAFTGTDADVNNQPIGFTFEVSVLAMPVETSLRITLEHYGRFGFKGSTPDPEFDLDFSVLLSVS